MSGAGGLLAILLLTVAPGAVLHAQDGASRDVASDSSASSRAETRRLAVDELLANPRLTQGAAGWQLESAEALDDAGVDGGAAVRLFSPPDAATALASLQSFVPACAVGRRLELSVRARGECAGGELLLSIHAVGRNGSQAYPVGNRRTTFTVQRDAWSTASVDLVVPAGTTLMTVSVVMSGEGEVTVDEVSLRPAEPSADVDPELAESTGLHEFDALVARTIAFVRRVRGRPFARRPRAQLLRPDAFRVAHPTAGTGETERRIRPMLRLLGLVPADFDFEAVWAAAVDEPPAGVWSEWWNTASIRGDVPRAALSGLLVHEFAHAFDHDAARQIAARRTLRDFDADDIMARRSVSEGAAMITQGRWAREAPELSPVDEPAALLALDAPYLRTSHWSGYFLVMNLLPYAAGWQFFEHGIERFPGATLDELIRRAWADPPRSASQVLHPELYWDVARREPPRVLPEPVLATLDEAWEVLQTGALGEPLLALATGHRVTLSEDIEEMRALRWTHPPTEGWAGDAWRLFASPGGHAVLLVTGWTDALEAAEFAAALSFEHPSWVDRRDDLVYVVVAEDALDLDALRAALLAD